MSEFEHSSDFAPDAYPGFGAAAVVHSLERTVADLRKELADETAARQAAEQKLLDCQGESDAPTEVDQAS